MSPFTSIVNVEYLLPSEMKTHLWWHSHLSIHFISNRFARGSWLEFRAGKASLQLLKDQAEISGERWVLWFCLFLCTTLWNMSPSVNRLGANIGSNFIGFCLCLKTGIELWWQMAGKVVLSRRDTLSKGLEAQENRTLPWNKDLTNEVGPHGEGKLLSLYCRWGE